MRKITNFKETIIEEKIPFQVTIPIIERTGDTKENPRTRIVGLARTTEVSLNHLKTTENFIASIKRQVRESQPKIPSFLDHDSNKVIGSIIDVKKSPDTEFWPITELLDKSGNDIVDAPIIQVEHWLDQEVRLGNSIGGHMTKVKYVEDLDTDEWWFEADEGILLENSVTPIPAQMETNGTISITESCKSGFCNQLGEQVQDYLIKSDNPIGEALKEKLGQREEKIEDKTKNLEVPIMAEKNENDKLTSLTEKVDKITEYINKDIQAKEQAEKKAQEKQAREELKNELKEEVAKEFTNEVVPSIAKIFNEAWDAKFKEMVGDRTHIQQSATGTTKPEDVKENSVVQIIEQRQSDPKYSILENHKSVVMGQTVKGYTPTEMFNLDS